MSLNGLDDVKVKEAHDAAIAEPGGWFLLKYASRDEVELLGTGNGGIVEVRNAIAAHEDPTPLFGFLRYRRKNVILKYVPEDCSRLVKVRLVVHFNAITERFSPYDTTFELASAKELKDSKLSAACSLHTASGSTSSSTSSLRRRRLMEITEDEEDEHRAKRQSTVMEERPPSLKAYDISDNSPTDPAISAIPSSLAITPDAPTSSPSTAYRSIIADLETTPPPPRETLNLEVTRPESPTRTIDDGRRKSSQSTRPDLFSYSSYGSNGKPKVKLGPRPSLDVGSRPHTASSSLFRPVSSLPAGLKLSKSPSKSKERPHTQYKQSPPSMTISPPSAMETQLFAPQTRTFSGGRPTTSSGVSIRPLPSPSSIAPSMKFPHMTPEKTRLMKALELRKRKEQQAAAAESPTPKPRDIPLPEDGLPPVVEVAVASEESPKKDQETLKILTDLVDVEKREVAFDALSTSRTDESDATRSDAFSPGEASEKAQSTRASSVSESTDETVQETKLDNVKEVLPEEVAESKQAEPEVSKGADAVKEEESPQLQMLLPLTYTPPTTRSPASGTTAQENIDHDEDFIRKLKEFENGDETSAKRPDAAQPEETITRTANPAEEETKVGADPREDPQAIEQSSVSTKELVVPRSKFSKHSIELDAAATQGLSQASSNPQLTVEGAPGVEIDGNGSDTQRDSFVEKKKRRGLVDPIRTDIDTDRSGANSETHFSSDDELMDELQSAVVEKAMPISVSKSPISPVFPSPEKSKRFSRSFSNPLKNYKNDSKLVTPPPPEKRKVSAGAAFLNKISNQQDKPTLKKVNVGSGISQRIKALEKLSTTGASPTAIPTSTPGSTTTSFFAVRKASVRDASNSSILSVADRTNSLSRNTPSPSTSREGSPEVSRLRERSGSIQNRVDAFKSSPIPMSKYNKPTTESVSVTARIVRDAAQPFPAKAETGHDAADYKPLALKQSPLVINHQKATPETPQPSKETIQERRMSKESSRSTPKNDRERRSSITVIKDFISEGRTSFSEKRRSMNLESVTIKSPPKSPTRPPSSHTTRGMSISSRLSFSGRDSSAAASPTFTTGSSSSTNEEKAEKKSSRTSRMMQRMSSSISSSRKTMSHAMSPTVREESEPFQDTRPLTSGAAPGSATPSSSSTSLGEVNVQFPDSLLWKRRSMALDSQGFLVLTASGTARDKQGVGASRRFHLGEFRLPAIPDVEMQELPHSVVLDFVEGGGLQVACEDRAGQNRVLKVLQEAHRTWGAYGQ